MHTNGPWKIYDKDKIEPSNGKGGYIAYVYGVDHPTSAGVRDEAIANASLIAAAPELLAACEAYRNWVNAGSPPAQYRAHVDLMDAAIAKAKGGVA